MKIKINRLEYFLLKFTIIDICFLPYFNLISTGYSMPLIFLWFVLRGNRLINKREKQMYYIFFFIMMVSTAISFVLLPNNLVLLEGTGNIKKMIQYSSYFWYYFFFKHCFNKETIRLKKYLFFFMIFAFLLALVYNYSPVLFATIKFYWNTKDSFLKIFEDGTGEFRYNFIWTDPNNPAYAFVSVYFFLFYNEQINLTEKIVMFFILIYLLISAMSTGAFLSLLICIFIGVMDKLLRINKIKISSRMNVKKLITIVISLAILFYLIFLVGEYLKSDVATTSFKRINNNSDSGTHRTEIWKELVTNSNMLEYIFFGKGAATLVDGAIKNPHNGHLYILFGYGAIAYAIFMYTFFRKPEYIKIRNFLFVLPVFIGFTINTIIGEQKFINLYLILFTSTLIYCRKRKNKGVKNEETS